MHHRKRCDLPQQRHLSLAPSEVCSPSAFFQPCGATYTRHLPWIPVTLRPRGFSPPRRFAPRATYRACFIPIPLLGFTLRGFYPRAAPYVLSNAGSLMGFRPRFRKSSACPSRGSSTPPEARTGRLGFSQDLSDACLLGLYLPRFLVSCGQRAGYLPASLPSRALSPRPSR